MIEKSFGLFFFLKKPKNTGSEERYIYLRVTVDGISKEVSTKRMWSQARWDGKAGRPKGKTEDVTKLNVFLDSIRSNVYSIKSKLILAEKDITADVIKNHLSGKGDEKKMLVATFRDHNKKIEDLIGVDYKYRTFQRYRTTLSHTSCFIDWKYCKSDIELKDLNYEFANDFAFWLKTVKKCNHNSTMKYISTLKSVLLECKKKKWLKDDPFIEFSTAMQEVEINPLDNEELIRIRQKDFGIPRLDLVKDIFIFSCYTGLAYIEVANLTEANVTIGCDGQQWIFTRREKTGSNQRIPILPIALDIINKYRGEDKVSKHGHLLPILSNQKMNSYLKEIADSCRIKKKLTFHLARHTFATTVTLSNGVPIESVSKMLGHKSLKQTQHYAKVVDLKVSHDMAQLLERIS